MIGKAFIKVSTDVPQTMQGIEVSVAEFPTWATTYVPEKKVSLLSFYNPLYGPVGAAFSMSTASYLQTTMQQQCFLYLDSKS